MYMSSDQRRSPIVVRMTEKDRKSLNRKTAFKRNAFKVALQKGITAMFNTQEEIKLLASERGDLLGFLKGKNDRRAEQLKAGTESLAGVTNGAPMGIGTGINIAATGVRSVGTAILSYENAKLQEDEIRARLKTAQMLHYISPENYEVIAESVALLLADHFEPVLTRLATGENGIKKLANFLLQSMDKYANKRLPEHGKTVKGGIQALIDAAIPPSTDAISYREWPQVDVRNFKVKLSIGVHETLELDEEVNEIIERCGPAVRAILGAGAIRVDPITGKVTNYGPYTLIGVLNHAALLDSTGCVYSGIETNHRSPEALDGTTKYPMYLLSHGETTADVGVNFIPNDKGQTLKDEHVEVVRRLFPGFFSREMFAFQEEESKTTQEAINSENQPLNDGSIQIDPVEAQHLCYPNERYEYPWTPKRERARIERLQTAYKAARRQQRLVATLAQLDDEEDEIATTSNYEMIKAMRMAVQSFDMVEANRDVEKASRKAQLSQLSADAFEDQQLDRSINQLKAVEAAQFAALSATTLMEYVTDGSKSNEQYFYAAQDAIEAARSALNVTRGLPIENLHQYRQILNALASATQSATSAVHQQQCYAQTLQIAADLSAQWRGSSEVDKFYHSEKNIQSKQASDCRKQARRDVELASEWLAVANHRVASIGRTTSPPLTTKDALQALRQAIEDVRSTIDSYEDADAATIIATIKRYGLEVQKNHDDIHTAMRVEDTIPMRDKPWVSETNKQSPAGINLVKADYLTAANQALTQANNSLTEAEALINSQTRLQRLVGVNALLTQLRAHKQTVKQARDTSIAILDGIHYREDANLVHMDELAGNAPVDSRVHINIEDIGASEEKTTDQDETHASINERQFGPDIESDVRQSTVNILSVADEDAFWNRSKAATELNTLRLIVSEQELIQRQLDASTQSTKKQQVKKPTTMVLSQELQNKLQALNAAVRRWERANKSVSASHAAQVFQCLSDNEDKLNATLPLHEQERIGRDIRLARQSIEIMLAEDIDVANVAERHALLAVADTQRVGKTIEEIIDRLRSFQAKCFVELEADSESLTSQDTNGLLTRADESSDTMIEPSSTALVNQLEKLAGLFTYNETAQLQTQSAMVEEEPATKHPAVLETDYARMTRESLGRLVEYCSAVNYPGNLTREIINKKITENILALVDTIQKDGICSIGNNWGMWLVAKTAGGLIEMSQAQVVQSEHDAKEAHDRIHQLASKGIKPELRNAIRLALNNIQQAYQAVNAARNRRAPLDHHSVEEWDLISSTLAWARKLTHIEAKGSRDERRKKSSKALTFTETKKSTNRMFYDLILKYSTDRLEGQKAVVGQINQFRAPLKRCYKKIHDLQQFQQCTNDDIPEIPVLIQSYQRLFDLVKKKRQQAESEQTDFESFRESILAKRSKIHFTEWKDKTYDPDAQSELSKEVRAAKEQRKKREEQRIQRKQEEKDAAEKEEHEKKQQAELAQAQEIKYIPGESKAARRLRLEDEKRIKEEKKREEEQLIEEDKKLEKAAANTTIEDLNRMLEGLQIALDELYKAKNVHSLSQTVSIYRLRRFDSSPDEEVASPVRRLDSMA